jgi:excinuclease UvrABC ATPase subunit
VFEGSPEKIIKDTNNFTGQFLKKHILT